MMNLIDTHFHLDHYRNYFEIAKTITELEQYTICVTNSPGIFLSCKNLIPEKNIRRKRNKRFHEAYIVNKLCW